MTESTSTTDHLMRSRWRGQPGRLEVWYTTFTDPRTGIGVWIHHELCAPTGGAPVRNHGWIALFPPNGSPILGRFGPTTWRASTDAGVVFSCGEVELGEYYLRGCAEGKLAWDLECAAEDADALFTFPRWAWRRELLPAAQVVPHPRARFSGIIRHGNAELVVTDAPGATARIYGHGNARRWGWLHADLDDGGVCEVVAAVSTRPVLRHLPPVPFVRLRFGGAEWPVGDPLLAALRFRATLSLPTWRVHGRAGDRRVEVVVTQPPHHTVEVDYTNPDGSSTVCRNTELATAEITLSRRTRSGWGQIRRWVVEGAAHAEVGGDITYPS